MSYTLLGYSKTQDSTSFLHYDVMARLGIPGKDVWVRMCFNFTFATGKQHSLTVRECEVAINSGGTQ